MLKWMDVGIRRQDAHWPGFCLEKGAGWEKATYGETECTGRKPDRDWTWYKRFGLESLLTLKHVEFEIQEASRRLRPDCTDDLPHKSGSQVKTLPQPKDVRAVSLSFSSSSRVILNESSWPQNCKNWRHSFLFTFTLLVLIYFWKALSTQGEVQEDFRLNIQLWLESSETFRGAQW